MAKSKLIDTLLLQRFWDGFKDVISSASTHIATASGNPHNVTATDLGLENVENKSSATIRNELTYSDIVNGLGYIPSEAADLSVYNFEIINDELVLNYPDGSPAPDVYIDEAGDLIWTYVE